MFDADTVALIAAAPALDGLDLTTLPQRLTNAYASIVAARIRVREATEGGVALPAETVAIITEMQRVAFAHEGLVSALPERDDRTAAAFVAGAAHHICLLAERMRRTSSPTRLHISGISPEVSATLLFLVAEASADAAEAAKHIRVEVEEQVETRLLSSIRHLAQGALRELLDEPIPTADSLLVGDAPSQAVRALYFLALIGVRELAARLIGLPFAGDRRVDINDPIALFERVRELSVATLDPLEGMDAGSSSVYPGPFHLASLLALVARDLLASALVNVQPPTGVDAGRWRSVLERMARRRPYLWRNHRQAIAAGYLEPGASAAISFPTGAGKSTIAELKIAGALLRGRRVVFLAPTLALVEQTATALSRTFPTTTVEREQVALLVDEHEELPEIAVMTPERCLTLLSYDRDVFVDVGLFAFDECHLLHPQNPERNRRAIDAMLCVLNFAAVAPAADFLFLSAMMSNSDEIARWLADLTGRPCLSLPLNWKPTRQVRGCVVYNATDIAALDARLREAAQFRLTKSPSASLRRQLTVHPYGFFCLRQTWLTAERDDYALLPLLEEPVTLSTGTYQGNWYLTPNGNHVAAAIAGATAKSGLKTLVFVQTVTFANAVVANLNEALGDAQCRLTPEETRLHAVASDEAGGPHRLYLECAEDGHLQSSSACHHGLLLPSERSLHESLFRRADGIDALVATSTLAQGMNLPSEIVIIQGDSRFDPSANRMERLEAHELLNAAGRAGRAGESSNGVVLVIPSKVVHFDDGTNTIHQHWAELRAIFAQSDQCVQIDDPLTSLLDQIHWAAAPGSEDAHYLLRRLPLGTDQEDGGPDARARWILSHSLAAYRARLRGDQAWVVSRIEAAIAARVADPTAPAVLTWADRLAASAGVPVGIVTSLGDNLVAHPLGANAGTAEWRAWMLAWLAQQPAFIPALIRNDSLEGLFGTVYRRLPDDESRGRIVIRPLTVLLAQWMAGGTLEQLERAHGTTDNRLGKCETARQFVLRVLPELAYVMGLAGPVSRALGVEGQNVTLPSIALETLGGCAREGFDRPEMLALRYVRREYSRIAVHRQFAELHPYLERAEEGETFTGLVGRVRRAVQERAGDNP